MTVFWVGDRVRWNSGGRGERDKEGVVVAVVPAFEDGPTGPQWTARWRQRLAGLGLDPDAYRTHALRSLGRRRLHESYVVAVGDVLYWPRVGWLRAAS